MRSHKCSGQEVLVKWLKRQKTKRLYSTFLAFFLFAIFFSCAVTLASSPGFRKKYGLKN
jgi:predicted PurR-regulated permease PerM